MLSAKKIICLSVFLSLLSAGCSKESENQQGDTQPPQGVPLIANSANEATFRDKSGELLVLLGRASAIGSNQQGSNRPLKPRGLVFAEVASFVDGNSSDINSPSHTGSPESVSDCAGAQVLFNNEVDLNMAEGKGASLYEGADCSSALSSVKSYYQRLINTAVSQVSALKTFDLNSMKNCKEFSVTKITDPSVALGYRVESTNPAQGTDRFVSEMRGAANDKQVSFQVSLELAAKQAFGSGSTIPTNPEPDQSTSDEYRVMAGNSSSRIGMTASGSVVGDLEGHSVALKSQLELNQASTNESGKPSGFTMRLNSATNASNLGENQLFSLDEHTGFSFDLVGGPNPQSMQVDIKMQASQLDASSMRVTGVSSISGTGYEPQTYELVFELKKDEYGTCRVSAVEKSPKTESSTDATRK